MTAPNNMLIEKTSKTVRAEGAAAEKDANLSEEAPAAIQILPWRML